jgi:hypothetical protein
MAPALAQVFYTTRASIPDVTAPSRATVTAAAAAGPEGLERFVLRFDSLKSLPTRLPPHMAAAAGDASGDGRAATAVAAQPPALPQAPLRALAAYLNSCLGLSLFGFDVVVTSPGGEWIIVVRGNMRLPACACR